MGEVAGWTLGELVEHAARALANADVKAPNGRVTPLPDGRMIRWYATIGLVDRPTAMRGRTALYGPRHLLQLVAIKRLQARGLTLVEIQAEFTGATDALLRRIANLSSDPVGSARGALDRAMVLCAADLQASDDTVMSQVVAFDGHAAASDGHAAASDGGSSTQREARGAGHGVSPPRPLRTQTPTGRPSPVLSGVRLAGGAAVLLLAVNPDAEDLAEIERAAAPLLELLVSRGLLDRSADGWALMHAEPALTPATTATMHDDHDSRDGSRGERRDDHR